MYNKVVDNSFILVFNKKKKEKNRRHRIRLKVCGRINKIIMGLTTLVLNLSQYISLIMTLYMMLNMYLDSIDGYIAVSLPFTL